VTHEVHPSPPAGAHEVFVASLFTDVIAGAPAPEPVAMGRARLTYRNYQPLESCSTSWLAVEQMAKWDLPGIAPPTDSLQCLEPGTIDIEALRGSTPPQQFYLPPVPGRPSAALVRTDTHCVVIYVEHLLPSEVACLEGGGVPPGIRDCSPPTL